MREYIIVTIIFSLLMDLASSYKMLTLEDPSLCSPITKRRIKLGSESQSGLIVSINSLKDHSLDWDKNFFCKFLVEVPKHNGIFAVIQKLAFRKNMETNECIDYLHLKKGNGDISKKYCGNFSAIIEMDSNSKFVVGDRTGVEPTSSFGDHTGQLDVNIHIAKEALQFDEDMELEIVFTSYRLCDDSMSEDHICGDPYYDNCIYKGFINDTYINCPYLGCVDESGCGVKAVQTGQSSQQVSRLSEQATKFYDDIFTVLEKHFPGSKVIADKIVESQKLDKNVDALVKNVGFQAEEFYELLKTSSSQLSEKLSQEGSDVRLTTGQIKDQVKKYIILLRHLSDTGNKFLHSVE